MKRTVQIGVAVALLAVGFALGRWGSGATDAEWAARDSLAAASQALDSTRALAQAAQHRADSVSAAAVAQAAAAVRPARTTTDSFFARIPVPDTGAIRAAVDSTRASVDSERAASDRHVAALEADTTLKARQLLQAWAYADSVARQRDAARRALDAALASRREAPVTLGAGVGYGVVASGGALRAGPGLLGGLVLRIRLPLPRWLGG